MFIVPPRTAGKKSTDEPEFGSNTGMIRPFASNAGVPSALVAKSELNT
jgi:hypothetical protein